MSYLLAGFKPQTKDTTTENVFVNARAFFYFYSNPYLWDRPQQIVVLLFVKILRNQFKRLACEMLNFL